MVRTSDLVRGKLVMPASRGAGRVDETRLSDLTEPVNCNTKAPPDISPKIKDIYLDVQNYLQGVREKLLLTGEPPGLERPRGMIERIIAEPSLFGEMYQLTLAFEHGEEDLDIASDVNTMIYCLKIGVRMGYTPFRLTELCLAALHHDVGMFLVPEAILRKESNLTGPELDIIKKHTAAGRDLLKSFDSTYPNIGRAVYEHHERESGQGYPRGIKGDEICEYAKIIGICDCYEAMTHDRPYRKAAEQYISVLELARTKALLFKPHIVKAFLDEITFYPIGSYVRLNNKAIGVVVQTNRSNPFKPTVQIVVDGHGNRVSEEKLLNLAETHILTIVTGIKADDVPA